MTFQLFFSREPSTKHQMIPSFPIQCAMAYKRTQKVASLRITIASLCKMSATKIGLLFWLNSKNCSTCTKKMWYICTKRKMSKYQRHTTQLHHKAIFLKFSICLSMVIVLFLFCHLFILVQSYFSFRTTQPGQKFWPNWPTFSGHFSRSWRLRGRPSVD